MVSLLCHLAWLKDCSLNLGEKSHSCALRELLEQQRRWGVYPANASAGSTVLTILQMRNHCWNPLNRFLRRGCVQNHTSGLPAPTRRLHSFNEQYLWMSTGARYGLRCVECYCKPDKGRHLPFGMLRSGRRSGRGQVMNGQANKMRHGGH